MNLLKRTLVALTVLCCLATLPAQAQSLATGQIATDALSLSGTVNTAGAIVTWVSGPQFSQVLVGENLDFGGTILNVLSVQSPTQLTLNASYGTGSGVPVSYGNDALLLSPLQVSGEQLVLSPWYVNASAALSGCSTAPEVGLFINGTEAGSITLTNGAFQWSGTVNGGAGWPYFPGGVKPNVQATVLGAGVGCNDSAAFPLTIAIDYYASTSTLTLTPSTLAFGNVAVGQNSAPQTLILADVGSNPAGLELLNFGLSDAVDYTLAPGLCLANDTIPPGHPCQWTVTFHPLGVGALPSTLTILSTAGNSPTTLAITGTGTAPAPQATITPAALDFGGTAVGSISLPQTITLKNTGTATLTFLSYPSYDATHFPPETWTCVVGEQLLPGQSCTLTLAFHPTALTSYSSTFTFVTNDPVNGSINVPLTGAGVNDWTEIEAHDGIIDAGGNRLTSGQLCLVGTNPSNVPLNFRAGSGGQVITRPICVAVTNGGIPDGALYVPDSSQTTPANVVYQITATSNTSFKPVLQYNGVYITGPVFLLDNYLPTPASYPLGWPGLISIQMLNAGTPYGLPMTGVASLNCVGCAFTGTAPNFVLTPALSIIAQYNLCGAAAVAPVSCPLSSAVPAGDTVFTFANDITGIDVPNTFSFSDNGLPPPGSTYNALDSIAGSTLGVSPSADAYATPTGAPTVFTVTPAGATGSNLATQLGVLDLSGVGAVDAHAVGGSIAGGVITCPAVTTTTSADVVLCFAVTSASGNTFAAGSGFVLVSQLATGTDTMGIEASFVTVPGSVTPTMTASSGDLLEAYSVAFKYVGPLKALFPVSVTGGGSGSGVTSFNTRTGAVTPQSGDYGVGQITGAAPLASPALTGTPSAPTQSSADTSTDIATDAFVHNLLSSGGVTSFNTRTGAVTPQSGDYAAAQITGLGPLATLASGAIPSGFTVPWGQLTSVPTLIGIYGTITAGHCTSWFNTTTLQDAGPCNGGSVATGAVGQFPEYNAAGANVAPSSNLYETGSPLQQLNYVGTSGISAPGFSSSGAGSGYLALTPGTVANLDSGCPSNVCVKGTLANASDGNPGCAAGGGSTYVTCRCDAATCTTSGWDTVGSSSSGVTSVGMTGDGTIFNAAVPGSPITASGTLAPTLHTQSANCVLAGPSSGSAAAPTCRSLVAADVPAALSNTTSVNGTTVPSGVTLTQTLCSGTITFNPGAIASNAASSAATATCTGLATTDAIRLTAQGDLFSTTGYVPGAMLTLESYPTSNTINVKAANNTGSSITPSSVTFNYQVVR